MPDKPLDETKAIKAADIVRNPEDIRLILQPCILVMEMAVMSMAYESFIAAINILVEDGWRVDPPMMNGSYLYALCYNPRFKRKNAEEMTL